jgi:regulator of replication initiation timing
MVKKTETQVKEFKQFKKSLIEEWTDLAIEQAKLDAKESKNEGENS